MGVAGTGFIGPAHIEGLRRNGIQVIGLAEETPEKARQKAVELGIPRAYNSLDEMLADPDIDVVHLGHTELSASPARQSGTLGGQARGLREAAGNER